MQPENGIFNQYTELNSASGQTDFSINLFKNHGCSTVADLPRKLWLNRNGMEIKSLNKPRMGA